MNNAKIKWLARNGLIAAIYTVVSLVISPIAFGAAQCRVSEALTLLPVLNPSTLWGITLGCALTNLVGAATGANFLGIADIFIGSGATLAAALLTARLGKYRFHGLPILAALPPILINAVVIGAEMSYVVGIPFLAAAGLIALGQTASCVLGLMLVHYLEKSGAKWGLM
ncbi:MAG: QueT transporter family protein [Angelakisella sp.]